MSDKRNADHIHWDWIMIIPMLVFFGGAWLSQTVLQPSIERSKTIIDQHLVQR